MLSARELTAMHLEERIEMDNKHAKQFEQLLTQHSKETVKSGKTVELLEKHETELDDTNKFFSLERQRLYNKHEKEFEDWRELKKLSRSNQSNITHAEDLEAEKRRLEFRKELEELRRVTRERGVERE